MKILFIPIQEFQTIESSSCWKKDTWKTWSKPQRRWGQTKLSRFSSWNILYFTNTVIKFQFFNSNFLLISQVSKISELKWFCQQIDQNSFDTGSVDNWVEDLSSRDLIKFSKCDQSFLYRLYNISHTPMTTKSKRFQTFNKYLNLCTLISELSSTM